jgi:hypothetical protein
MRAMFLVLLVCTQAASFSERFGVWTTPPPCWAFEAAANNCRDSI